MLRIFFTRRGFDVLEYSSPDMCSVYETHSEGCSRRLKCSDVLITDMTMPRMTGTQLLEMQQQKGCKLSPLNKAVISGNIDDQQREEITATGSAYFRKPFQLSEVAVWLDECRSRIDLNEQLEALERRREDRHPVSDQVRFSAMTDPLKVFSGTMLNVSDSGFCAEAPGSISPGTDVLIKDRSLESVLSATVRWVFEKNGSFVAGFLYR